MVFKMPTSHGISNEILNAALAGLEQQRNHVTEQIAQVRAMLGTAPKRSGRPPKNAVTASTVVSPQRATRKRRRMSAAARKKIADATRKRWAAARKAGRAGLGGR